MIKTAILVDGGFYRKRAFSLWGEKDPLKRAEELRDYCYKHLQEKDVESQLYRIFYYDCPPLSKEVFHPLLGKEINMKKSYMFEWTNNFYDELIKQRKLALRLGTISEEFVKFNLKEDTTKQLLKGKIGLNNLTEEDFYLKVSQKGVDMRIGLDIATLSSKKQVDQIILISGDSDFIPAAKHARREGVDFILDSMGAHIRKDLLEHIDGLR